MKRRQVLTACSLSLLLLRLVLPMGALDGSTRSTSK